MATDYTPNRSLFDEVMVPNYSPGSVIPVRGEGSYVWDQNDNQYIDFAGGIAVSAVGHAHPALIKALNEQASKLWHLSNVMTNEPALMLAKKLTELSFAEKVYFANSGAEANEAAFKLARRYAWDKGKKDKNEILSFRNSFHGRTLFTVSVGGQAKYTEGFEPVPGGILHAEYNNIESVKALISENTCAIVIEPIQGEGGVIPADPEFLSQLRKLCDDYEALLIFDEIQTGAGRTGELYAYMNSGVVPDILTTAKGLGGGFPIAAMLTKTDIAASLSVGTHGSTYGGNPLGCAVTLALLDEISKPAVRQNVRTRGEQLRSGLEAINSELNVFTQIRGQGLLLGAEFKPELQGKAKDFMASAMEQGLMILVAGPNVLRFAPSLLIEENTIEEGLAKLKIAIQGTLDSK